MQFVSKLSHEQWAEVRRLRAGGASYAALAERFGIAVATICKHARKEGWLSSPRTTVAAPRRPATGHAAPASASPGTASIRSRLALRLYRVIECKIRMMELRMIKELQAHQRADSDGLPPPPIADERESFSALIASINQVTEMASEPATATEGRRRDAAGTINPELTALSTDIDPDGLAVASEKDNYRRELAEHLGKMFLGSRNAQFY